MAVMTAATLLSTLTVATAQEGGPASTATVGTLLVQPSGSRLSVGTFVGDALHPHSQLAQFDDFDNEAPARLQFIQSQSLDDFSSSCGVQTAHADGSMEVHVVPHGSGGATFTIACNATAITTSTASCGDFPSASAQGDSGFAFMWTEANQYAWSYVCHADVQDDSDQKDQANVRIVIQSPVIDLAQAGIPRKVTLGGYRLPDGSPPSTLDVADFNKSGVTPVGDGYVEIFPAVFVIGTHPGRQVKAHLTITFTLDRISGSGACCASSGCAMKTAAECAAIGGSFLGAGTSCSASTPCATGACCTCDGSCSIVAHALCQSTGGAYQGDGTTCGSSSACALGTQWKDATSAPFETPARWINGIVPAAAEATVFDQPGSYVVHFDQPRANDRTAIRNGNVTFENASYDLTVQNANPPSLAIGSSGTLRLHQCPLVSSRDATIGYCGTSPCALVLNDTNLISSGTLSLGGSAPGKLTISGSSAVTSAASRIGDASAGEAELDGSAVAWEAGDLDVGRAALGTLNVRNGAKVHCSTLFAGQATGNGTIVVDGAAPSVASRLESSGEIVIGQSNSATLDIKNGALLRAKGELTLGSQQGASGKIIVTAPGTAVSGASGFLADADLNVGHAGTGALTLQKNTLAFVKGAATLGHSAGATGTIIVEDGASWGTSSIQNKLLTVGEHGKGVLTIRSGATVASKSCVIGLESDGDGDVSVMNGPPGANAWELTGDLDMGLLGGAATLSIDGAAVHVSGKLTAQSNSHATITLTPVGKLLVDGGATIETNGKIAGAGLFVCPLTIVKMGGTLETTLQVPGAVQFLKAKSADRHDDIRNDLCTLTIAGDLELQEGSAVRVDVGGAREGEFAVLRVSGNATLGGILEMHFVNGFVPAIGDALPVVRVAGATVGSFSKVIFPDAPEGFAADIQASDGSLSVVMRRTPQSGGPGVAPRLCGLGLFGPGLTSLLLMLAASTRTRRRASKEAA